MARKKKIEEAVPVEVVVEPAPVADVWQACGHRNMHYAQGVLVCDMEAGHAGDHSGIYLQAGVPTRSEWSDAAGKPPAPVVVSQEEDYARKHKTNGLEIESQARPGRG